MKVSQIDTTQYLSIFETRLSQTIGNDGSILGEGMRYACLDGGKRVRPLCVFFGARAICQDVDVDEIARLAVGVELIHNYSLVHDDLPAMDNDDYRRGKLSVHKKFGHANGILIGDQLLTEASFTLMDGARLYGTRFARAAQEILSSAKSMVVGQVNDLGGCESEDDYLDTYSQKTAALIRGAFTAGAICAGANFEQIQKIGEFGELIGVSFQLADDILDDGEEGSITTLIGKDGASALLREKTNRAKALCSSFANAEELSNFADKLCSRTK